MTAARSPVCAVEVTDGLGNGPSCLRRRVSLVHDVWALMLGHGALIRRGRSVSCTVHGRVRRRPLNTCAVSERVSGRAGRGPCGQGARGGQTARRASHQHKRRNILGGENKKHSIKFCFFPLSRSILALPCALASIHIV